MLIARRWSSSARDRCLLILPLFHVNGLMVSVVSVLRAGGSTVIARQFAPDSFWHQIEEHRPTFFSAVPTICQKLTSLPEEVHPDVSSLRFRHCGRRASRAPADS